MEEQGKYLVIDLKSFYASVECVERGLDPMTTRLIVADPSRTNRTICLAASVGIKAMGVPNRCRVYQIPDHIDYIMAPPRMQLYLDYSSRIYKLYLKYFSPEDIHVYSVDEAFMDATHYGRIYRCSVRELAARILDDIRSTFGLYATCGIGTNMYLAKIALDIIAKHAPDFIGELTEDSYRRLMWDHKPLTDFWMIGRGTARRLAGIGIYTMRGIAMSDEHMLFRLFGVNAELLMDHAWGIETATIADIKSYKTVSSSISSGQVLARDYNYTDCRLIVKEICDQLCLQLVKKGKITSNISLWLGVSAGCLGGMAAGSRFAGIYGSVTLPSGADAVRQITTAVTGLYEKIADPGLYYRRVTVSFNNLDDEEYRQFDLFTDIQENGRDHALQQAALEIRRRFGKNAILKGRDLEEAGTVRERNLQIGGHRA